MPNNDPQLNAVFHALADPTRRAILAKLASRPMTVSDLAREHDMALPSFTQHLKVLENCGAVHSEKSGRVRTYVLTPAALDSAENWIEQHRRIWTQRLDQLDAYLHSLTEIKR